MKKPYAEMTPDERLQHRIATNRRIEGTAYSGNAGLSLDGIVTRLEAHRQRATYKAVAGLVGVHPRGLMTNKAKAPRYSWVVAGTNGGGAKRGWPTGYTISQIHPDCYRQICDGNNDIIDSTEALGDWLREKS